MVIFIKQQAAPPAPVFIKEGFEAFFQKYNIDDSSFITVEKQIYFDDSRATEQDDCPVVFETGKRVSQIPWPHPFSVEKSALKKLREECVWVNTSDTFVSMRHYGYLIMNGFFVLLVLDAKRKLCLNCAGSSQNINMASAESYLEKIARSFRD